MLNLKAIGEGQREAEVQRDADRKAQDGAFRRKVAIQQFMNSNGPLFRAFAASGTPIEEVVEGEQLRDAAAQAMRLAMLVAADLAGKDPSEVTAAEAKPFRSDAAEWVAARRLSGRPADVEAAAAEIAAAARLADGSWDHDSYRDDRISDDASLMITAAGVAGTLARQVEIYDFRQGREAVLGRLVKAVAEAASRTASEMLGKEATPGDVRNLTQTLARNLSSLMEACYERRSREVVTKLNGRPEREKAAWLASHDPLDQVTDTFREWTICFAGFAVAATRDLSRRTEDSPEPGAATATA